MEFSHFTTHLTEYLPRFLSAIPVALAIIVGTFLLNLVLGRAMVLLARRTHLTAEDVMPVRRLVCWVIRLVGLILILSVFGFQIGGIWAMLSTILGLVAIGFVAVWSLISHSTATMLLLLLRPFQVGDDIEFAGEQVRGRVVDINFFFTTLIDHDGMLQQIPNNLFFQKTLKRRKSAKPYSLAVQLHARHAADVGLPPPPASEKKPEIPDEKKLAAEQPAQPDVPAPTTPAR